jgi:hypothetical protein
MLPGFAGHLISEAFLESRVASGTQPPVNDEAARRLAAWLRRRQELGPASSLRAMLHAGAEPFLTAFGFDASSDLATREGIVVATVRDATRSVVSAALVVAPWGEPLEPLWREAARHAIERHTSWCFLFNGTHIRVLDAERLFTRRHVEFDLAHAADDPRSLAALKAVLDTYALRALVEESDRHAAQVCRSLRSGVLTASAAVLSALVGRKAPTHPLDGIFEQALTVVYRLLFLLFAEARALVPIWHPVYRESYSLEALRGAVEGGDGAAGSWDALRAIARLAHAGCHAGDLRVTPFNGRLFAPGRTPLADRPNLDDRAARNAILALSTRPSIDRAGLERIAYRDLGVEQLGAVYETLLDYRPVVHRPQRPRGPLRVELRAGSGVRKSTGTFYTPQAIAECVVRRTLGPLVRDAEPERILELKVLDPAMGSGAFLVAACRYLASAYETALVQAGRCHPCDLDERERISIRRIVAERCLYGVDLNPMAVQLARLSLWLTTLAADRPLSFLDHHLLTGNSLIGAWLALLNRTPRAGRPRRRESTGTRQPILIEELYRRDVIGGVLPVRFALDTMPSDTLEQVRTKERSLAAINSRGSVLRSWRQVADIWCASWLAGESVPPAAFGVLSDAVLTSRSSLSPRETERLICAAKDAVEAHRPFHWELEYPEIFFAPDGTRRTDAGFDAVLGNPPWEMLRADGDGNRQACRVVRFTRDAGVYRARSDGHANCYQLFLERAIDLTRNGGRIGLVLPSGVATDHGSASLRRLLLTRCDVESLVGFENLRAVFPIHRSIRFVLLAATAGRTSERIACRFGLHDPSELEALGEEPAEVSPWFQIRLRKSAIEHLSGQDLTIPWLRTPLDLELAERAAALFPPLGSDAGWKARFGRELNATEDRHLFRQRGEGMPVIGGRQIQPFAVDLKAGRWSVRTRDADTLLRDGRHARARLAYRDVAGATNQLTLIAAVLPAGSIATHTVFTLRTALPPLDQHLLCALFNSFVVNYLVRLRVSMHVTVATVERLPVPMRGDSPAAARELAALARILSRRRDPAAAARLQARVAALYRLNLEEFEYVLSTFPLVAEESRRAALRAFVSVVSP